VTIAKLRWLLGKATSTLGEKRIADMSSKNAYALAIRKRYRKPTYRRVDARWTPKLVLVAPSDNERK